jgi:hypothetical protein
MSTNENKISPDDPRLTAYALGELEGAELAEVEAALRADPAAQAVVAQIRVAADQLQAALAGETVEAAAGGADRVPSAQRDGRARSWPRPLLWYASLGGLAAAFLAVLAVRESLRGPAHEPEAVVALLRSNPLAAAKAPAMEVMEAKVEPDGAGANAGSVRALALAVSTKRAANEIGGRSHLSEAAVAGFAGLPRAMTLVAAPRVHPYIQDQGIFYRSSPDLMNCDPRIFVSTGRLGTAVDKDFEILAVPVPNLGAAQTAGPPMNEGGIGTGPNGSLSIESDLADIFAAAREAYGDVRLRIQAEEGTPFEQLATAPDGGRLPGLDDVKLRFSESMPRP